MDITTATPAQIDEALALLDGERADIAFKIERAQASLAMAEDAVAGIGWRRYLTQADVDSARSDIAALDAEFAATSARMEPLDAEWVARGRWTRAFLVQNAGGHVHSTMACNTCFATTRFGWLTQFSDHDESEIVAAAGQKACTVCYPSAPVDVLARKSTIEMPGVAEARAAREVAKAEREAKKIAKAITTPGGDALRVDRGGYPQTLATLASAKMWLTDASGWGIGTHPSFSVVDADLVAASIAAKVGTTAEVEMAAAAKRSAKRR